MKCEECKQLAVNVEPNPLISFSRLSGPGSPSMVVQNQPVLGLSAFRHASDFLGVDTVGGDCKENDVVSLNRFDIFDMPPQSSPQLGDLIEIDRTLFSHWALYVGDGRIVHVVGEDGEDLPNGEHAIVKEDFLTEVAGSSYVRVNNKDVPGNLQPTWMSVIANFIAFFRSI